MGKLPRPLLRRPGRPQAEPGSIGLPATQYNAARRVGPVWFLAKTDEVDAKMLAAMGHALAPMPSAPADIARESLGELHKRRDQLVAIRACERARLSDKQGVRHSLQTHIAWLDAEIARIDILIATAIRASQAMAEDLRLMRSAPGVGPVTATTLIALMPELGTLTPKTAAALAGLAPFNADSGQFRGVRRINGGRRRVRKALYMAAVSAARHPRFSTFYKAMRERGKPAKLAFVALARKLIVMLNAILRDRVAYHAAP